MSYLKRHLYILLVLLLALYCTSTLPAYSENLTSSSFQIENSTLSVEGGISTSTSFQYFSSTGVLSTSEATSTSFLGRSGFLYFPIATSPVVSTTAGNAKVDLTWTSAVGTLANVTRYEVGVSTNPSSGFTYTSVGNVLLYTVSSLTNGTTYYFKVKAYADGAFLSESAVVDDEPTGGGGSGGGGGSSGGGGGGGDDDDDDQGSGSDTGVEFSGRAYPLSKVGILKDGQLVLSTIAGPDSNFSATIRDLSTGHYTFSVYGEDNRGVRSSPFTFSITTTSGVMTKIGGIFIAPTIAVDKNEVKRGDTITIFGQSAKEVDVVINVNSENEFFVTRRSDANGIYLANFDSSVLELGQHSTKSKATKGNEISVFSKTVNFKVGTQNVIADTTSKCPLKGDLNSDCRVNLVDFSIAAYWYKRVLPASFIAKEAEHLNADGKVDLVDFSIMAYYWTG